MKKWIKIGIFLIMPLFLGQLVNSQESYFEKARELYNKGPKFAPEIIKLLKKEIEINPENLDAYKLLGITYFGIGDFQEALPRFNRVIEKQFLAPNEDGSYSVPTKIIIYKIRSLTNLDRFQEARREESKYWAFISDKEHASEYKVLRDEMNLREKVFYSSYSEKMIQNNENNDLENYYFIPIRSVERKFAEQDGDLKIFLLQNSDLKNSAYVLAVSEDNDDKFGYCVYFSNYKAAMLCKFNLKDFYEKKIVPDHLKENQKKISGPKYSIPREEGLYWTVFEIETDNKETILAFKKNPQLLKKELK
jgi:tetratricopeptide (TPR) repeat protein